MKIKVNERVQETKYLNLETPLQTVFKHEGNLYMTLEREHIDCNMICLHLGHFMSDGDFVPRNPDLGGLLRNFRLSNASYVIETGYEAEMVISHKDAPVKSTFWITSLEDEAIRAGRKIYAIKNVRERMQCSLVEAKQFVEDHIHKLETQGVKIPVHQ